MKIEIRKLHQITIRDSFGFNEKVFPGIDNLISQSKPIFYHFLSPHSFQIYFHADSTTDKLNSFLTQAKDFLVQNSETLEDTSILQLTEKYAIQKTIFGKISSAPLRETNTQKESLIWTSS